MKTSVLILLAALSAGLSTGLSAEPKSAAVTAAAVSSSAAAVTLTPTVLPTPVPLYVNYTPPDWAKAWDHISLKDAEKMHTNKKYLFLDARAKSEYDQGHIPGALPFPAGETEKYFAMYEPQIRKAKKLITYCHGIGCRLSEKAAKFLVEDKKMKNVAVFFGGEPQWRDAKLPMETGDSKEKKTQPKPTPTAAPAVKAVATAVTVVAEAGAVSPAASALTPSASPLSVSGTAR